MAHYLSTVAGDTTLTAYGPFADCGEALSNCPPDAADEVACNDDFCGLQSQISFSGGGAYLIQVGGYDGSQGSGDLRINTDAAHAIDLKPGSDPNCQNPNAKGQVAVAILTTPTFDATQVDGDTVTFGGALAVRCRDEDVDEDGDLDKICHFKVQDVTWPTAGSDCEPVALTAMTFNGTEICAQDVACIPGEPTCEANSE